MGDTVVSVERVINAPAADIFAIVADASRHPEIDGSGSVKQLKQGAPEQLSLGTTFGMSMKLGRAVLDVEHGDRVRAGQADRLADDVLSGPLGRFIGGRIWRYELEMSGGGSTLVRETWDITQDKQRFMLKAGPVGKQTARTP